MATPSAAPATGSDVCLVLEGTYPYVAGGVSSWVHDIVKSLPETAFSLLHIGARAGSYGAPRYELPANVTGMTELYCQGAEKLDERVVRSARKTRRAGAPSRTLAAIRRLHLEQTVDD